MQKTKSATTAGLLGIFLGQFGAHDWYLGKKKNGLIHAILAGVMLIIYIAAGIWQSNLSIITVGYYGFPFGLSLLWALGYIIALGNGLWGFIEGVIILAKGDAGLRAEGYSTPAAPAVSAAESQPAAEKPAEAGQEKAEKSSEQSTPAAGEESSEKSTVTPAAPATSVAPVAPAVSAAPVKKPMDPKTKKKIIMWSCIGGGVVVAAVILIIVLCAVLSVDYGETYRAAGELKKKISDLYTSYDCENIVDDYDSDWTSERTYNSYVSSCRDYISGNDELINKLGSTSGIKRDSVLSQQFDAFKKSYYENVPSESDLDASLPLYQAWHAFVVRVDDLSPDDSDSDFDKAIQPLVDSGNDELKNYGENWLAEVAGYRTAYKAYYNDSKSGSDQYKAMTEARTKFNDWVDDNEPDLSEIAPLDFSNISSVWKKFDSLYDQIAEAYEDNYVYGSGDCSEGYSTVICY